MIPDVGCAICDLEWLLAYLSYLSTHPISHISHLMIPFVRDYKKKEPPVRSLTPPLPGGHLV
jgi:hypothetical protein